MDNVESWEVIEMNVFKRAMISIERHLGKAIILLLSVFILATVIAGSLAVEGAVANAEANLRNNMRPVVSFGVDLDALNYYIDTYDVLPIMPTLTPGIIREIATLPYVNRVNYTIFAYIETYQLQGYHAEEMSMLRIQGTSETMPLPMIEGIIEMVDGDAFAEADLSLLSNDVHSMMISRAMAETNNLFVGSVFDFDLNVFSPQLDLGDLHGQDNDNLFASETFSLQVIGIFEPVTLEQSEGDWHHHMVMRELQQTIFTTNVTAEAFQTFQAENHAMAFEEQLEITGLSTDDFPWFRTTDEIEVMAHAVMELADVNDLETFRTVVTPLLPELMIVEDLTNSFANVSSSMQHLLGVADWILLITIGSSLLILSLLMVLFLRERRHEIGIYLALGERKSKIVYQLLIEVLVPTLIGITLAIFSGHVLSSMMSRHMLRAELAGSQHAHVGVQHFDPNSLAALNIAQEMTAEQALEMFEIPISMPTIGLFYFIGISIVIFSTVMPMMYILLSSPKKVLL